MSTSTQVHPFFANSMAVALPIPLAAPVTTAILFFRFICVSLKSRGSRDLDCPSILLFAAREVNGNRQGRMAMRPYGRRPGREVNSFD
jgi:hypothetical protein